MWNKIVKGFKFIIKFLLFPLAIPVCAVLAFFDWNVDEGDLLFNYLGVFFSITDNYWRL